MLNLIENKMKKITLSLLIVVLTLTIFPASVTAKTSEPTSINSTAKEIPAAVRVMFDRLKEIKEMDKSNLNSSERKALRKEVRAIKSTLKSTGNGVYLSVGAIIIIILVLILIL